MNALGTPYKMNFGSGVCDAHFAENCPVCKAGAGPVVDGGAGFAVGTDGKLVARETPSVPPPVVTTLPSAVQSDPIVIASHALAEAKATRKEKLEEIDARQARITELNAELLELNNVIDEAKKKLAAACSEGE